MPAVICPRCGEDDKLSGERRPDGTLEVTCLACGTVWDRDAERRCRVCGSDDLEYTPKALWEKGRGDQRTPAGEIAAYACWNCGGRDVTSSTPVPGPPDHQPSRRYEAKAGDE
jgi:hypothetical protein